jgi:hypothetical protein
MFEMQQDFIDMQGRTFYNLYVEIIILSKMVTYSF